MSGNRLELPAEIENVPIAHCICRFRHIHFTGKKQVLCLPDSDGGDILVGRHTHGLFEKHPEMAGTAMCHIRQFFN